MVIENERSSSTETSSPRGDVFIAGVGMTAFVESEERSLVEMLNTAATRALSDADVGGDSLGSLHVGNMAAEAFNGLSGLANALAGQLGAAGSAAHRIENTSASGASAFLNAVDAIRAGRSDVALVVGGEQMSTADTSTATDIIGRVTHEGEYEQGITLPSFAGLAAGRYLDQTGASRRDLARVAVKNHDNAARNPYAQFESSITVDDVLDSPPVAEPLRLYDCCPIGDGAAAVVLTSAPTALSVSACESGIGTHAVADRGDPLAVESVRKAGEEAFDAAGVGPEDVDVACIHDAFTVLEWLEMEELGFADTGEAWRLTSEGTTALDGDLPINPGGGLKARGHPLGATGVAQIVELVWQLRGEALAANGTDADDRTVRDATRGLALNVAGFGNNSVCTVLEVAA